MELTAVQWSGSKRSGDLSDNVLPLPELRNFFFLFLNSELAQFFCRCPVKDSRDPLEVAYQPAYIDKHEAVIHRAAPLHRVSVHQERLGNAMTIMLGFFYAPQQNNAPSLWESQSSSQNRIQQGGHDSGCCGMHTAGYEEEEFDASHRLCASELEYTHSPFRIVLFSYSYAHLDDPLLLHYVFCFCVFKML